MKAYLKESILNFGNFPQDRRAVVLTVLFLFCMTGVAMLVGLLLHRIMQGKGYKTHLAPCLAVPGLAALAGFLRFGLSVTAVQGVFLACLLLYASCSDLTDHHMDDHIWVTVLALGLCSVGRVGIISMLIGAAMVFVPQMLVSLIGKGNTLGGADIKLSTALAFLLGWQRGLAALMAGLLAAVIVMAIVQKLNKKKRRQPFALIPFLASAAAVVFFI